MPANAPLLVLIHGAWMGGFCWQYLVPALSAHALPVMAPTLRGCAERHDQDATTAGLYAHCDEVVALAVNSRAPAIVLAGHSYGAVVAVEAAARLGARVRAVVALDGFIGSRGHTITDGYPMLTDMFDALVLPAAPDVIQPAGNDLLGLSPGPETDALMARMKPMPTRAFAEPCRYDAADLECARHYIHFTAFPLFSDTAVRARRDGWHVYEINGGHMAIVTHAGEVAGQLAAIAAGLA